MKAALGVLLAVTLAPHAALADAPHVVTVLTDLDPVALTQGQEIAGSDDWVVVRGRYRYLFSDERNKALFEMDPERYAVQMGGACGRMGPLSGLGHPGRFLVHDGRIYLFASDACRDTFNSAPERFVDRDEAPPAGSPEGEQRARQLIDRALQGLGGAARVDRVASFQTRIRGTYKDGDRVAEQTETATALFPDRYRRDSRWGEWHGASVVAGDGGFRTEGRESWAMEEGERRFLVREFRRDPLVLLKARHLPGFQAVAAGRGKVDESEVEWLKVGFDGIAMTLGVDAATGRVLSVAYRGRLQGVIGEIVKTFSDFREAGGLILPFATTITFDGKPVPSARIAYDAMEVNARIDESLFRKPE
jgi:YHS domain-containing protein